MTVDQRGKIGKDGCEINFDGTGGFIHHKGRSLRFERVGDMFGIRVRVLRNSGSGNSVRVLGNSGSGFSVPGAHNPVMPTVDESSVFSPSASSSFNPNPVPSFDQKMSPLESVGSICESLARQQTVVLAREFLVVITQSSVKIDLRCGRKNKVLVKFRQINETVWRKILCQRQ